MEKKYPRDLIGYGSKQIKVVWPNNARLAIQIVLNYEEGGENSVLHGDKYSEIFLSEIIGAQKIKGRHINMESIYEYGSRRGFWRLHNLFQEKNIPVTIFGVAMALKRKKSDRTVWCFIGDMTFETGVFHESYKYAKNFNLPLQFVVEDNNLSVHTPTDVAWNRQQKIPNDIVYYKYDNNVNDGSCCSIPV